MDLLYIKDNLSNKLINKLIQIETNNTLNKVVPIPQTYSLTLLLLTPNNFLKHTCTFLQP